MSDHSNAPELKQSNLVRKFTHLVIPAEIWLRRDISIQARALWAELYSLHDDEKGGCFASDEYLMEFIGLRRSRLHEILKELKDANLMVIVSFNGRTTVRKATLENQSVGRQVSGKPDSTNPENRTSNIRDPGFTPYIYRKEERKDKYIAESTHSAPQIRAKVADISFSFEDRSFSGISEKDLNSWKELYPQTDIPRELKEMSQWILANPSKAKSKKLWRKFILNWLQRCNEKSTNRMAYQQTKYQSQKEQVLSRHTGFQQDNSPRPAHKTIDLSDL
jgi:hypothetical protein